MCASAVWSFEYHVSSVLCNVRVVVGSRDVMCFCYWHVTADVIVIDGDGSAPSAVTASTERFVCLLSIVLGTAMKSDHKMWRKPHNSISHPHLWCKTYSLLVGACTVLFRTVMVYCCIGVVVNCVL